VALITGDGYRALLWDDFRKGIHLRRSPAELDPPYLPGAINVTVRGRSLCQRFGTTLRGIPGATAKYVYHSPQHSTTLFTQEGTGLYSYALGPFMGSRTLRKTFTTADKIAMCEFVTGAGATPTIMIVHPVDGVFTFDGTTATSVSTTVKGSAIAAWQNKAWVGGGANGVLWWSNAGRGDLWTTSTDFVFVREKDTEPLTAVGVGKGSSLDAGRDGLLVFKRSSAYKVIDSETGEYVTLDAYRGAEGAESVAVASGGVFAANHVGVYRVTDVGLIDIHEPIAPDYDDPNIGATTITMWAFADRVYVSALFGYIFEYVPEVEGGSWWIHALNDNGTERGVISATVTADATSGNVKPRPYLLHDAGTRVLDMWDDVNGHAYASAIEMQDYAPGAAGGGGPYTVTAKVRFPWVELGGESFRVERVVIRGWGGSVSGTDVTPTVLRNYKTTGTAWGVRNLGGSAVGETRKRLNSVGVFEAFQLQLAASPTAGDNLPNPDPDNTIPIQIPGFGISLVRVDLVGLR